MEKRPYLTDISSTRSTPEADFHSLDNSSTSNEVVEDDFIFPCYERISQAEDNDNDSDGYAFPTESESDSDSQRLDSPQQGYEGEDKLLEVIGKLLVSRCCNSSCVRDLTANEVLRCRKKFESLNTLNQRQWISDKLLENSALNNGEMSTTYLIAGKNVCATAFCKVHGFSYSRLKRLKKSVKEDEVRVSEHGNSGRKRTTSKVEEVKTWMERYFHLIGDK